MPRPKIQIDSRLTTTLTGAPPQLAAWIEAIDAEIAKLTAQREAFAVALATFGDPETVAAIDEGTIATVVRERGTDRS